MRKPLNRVYSVAVERFLGLSRERIQGPYTYHGDSEKSQYHVAARAILRHLAKQYLGLTPDDYRLTTNPGGVAVSGETTLHSDRYYIQLGQTFCGEPRIFYRAVTGRKDYCGLTNRYLDLSFLKDPERLAAVVKFNCEIDIHQYNDRLAMGWNNG